MIPSGLGVEISIYFDFSVLGKLSVYQNMPFMIYVNIMNLLLFLNKLINIFEISRF